MVIGERFEVNPRLDNHNCKLTGGQHIIDILEAAGPHFRAVRLEFFRSTGHYGNCNDVFGFNLLFLCVVSLGQRSEHLLG